MIDHGVAVNAKRELWSCNPTALHVTAEHGAAAITELLLDAGADPNIHDDLYDATVLGWAEYCGQPEVAQLVRAGRTQVDISASGSGRSCGVAMVSLHNSVDQPEVFDDAIRHPFTALFRFTRKKRVTMAHLLFFERVEREARR